MLSALKWIGSVILAILLIGAVIGVVVVIANISTFLFIGVGILCLLALITYAIRESWDSKPKKQ